MGFFKLRYIKDILTACLLLLLVYGSLLINVASASSIQQLTIDDMLGTAELIFEGRVSKVQASWNSGRTAINTVVTFEIIDVIYGSNDSATIELHFSGGSADGLTMQIEGLVYPELGEQGVYFIEDTKQVLVNPIMGWSQGHFLVEKDADGEQRMSTADHQPIIEMTDESVSAQAISKGVAKGLRVNKRQSDGVNGMSKASFKQALKDKLAARNAQ